MLANGDIFNSADVTRICQLTGANGVYISKYGNYRTNSVQQNLQNAWPTKQVATTCTLISRLLCLLPDTSVLTCFTLKCHWWQKGLLLLISGKCLKRIFLTRGFFCRRYGCAWSFAKSCYVCWLWVHPSSMCQRLGESATITTVAKWSNLYFLCVKNPFFCHSCVPQGFLFCADWHRSVVGDSVSYLSPPSDRNAGPRLTETGEADFQLFVQYDGCDWLFVGSLPRTKSDRIYGFWVSEPTGAAWGLSVFPRWDDPAWRCQTASPPDTSVICYVFVSCVHTSVYVKNYILPSRKNHVSIMNETLGVWGFDGTPWGAIRGDVLWKRHTGKRERRKKKIYNDELFVYCAQFIAENANT